MSKVSSFYGIGQSLATLILSFNTRNGNVATAIVLLCLRVIYFAQECSDLMISRTYSTVDIDYRLRLSKVRGNYLERSTVFDKTDNTFNNVSDNEIVAATPVLITRGPSNQSLSRKF